MELKHAGRLAVYVTSHGFGHLNRTVAVLNHLPADVPLVIRCHPDLFPHWGERLNRPAAFEPHVSDAGAVNPPGNSAETDGPATLERAAAVHAEAMRHVDDEAHRLAAEGTAAVLCDAPPVPLVAARRAGIPGFLLANFTWADIYEPHARHRKGPYPAFVETLHEAYRHATALFRCEPALPMTRVAPLIEVGIVTTPGRDRRHELRAELGLTGREKLVYIYLGRYGQESIDWARVAGWARDGIHLIGFHPPSPSVPAPANLHVVAPDRWTGADLAASTDAMVAKAGYGTVCEAMAARTPLIYPPRSGFAEHEALVKAMTAWGGGLEAPREAFDAMRIEAQLARALTLQPGPPPYPTDGAARVAEYLTRVCRGLAVA